MIELVGKGRRVGKGKVAVLFRYSLLEDRVANYKMGVVGGNYFTSALSNTPSINLTMCYCTYVNCSK